MRSKVVLVVVSAVFVGAALAISFAIPRDGNQPPKATFERPPPNTSAIDLTVTVDSVDAATGSMRLRALASPGDSLPPEGAVLLTSIGGIPAIPVTPNRLSQEQSTTILFQKGDVVDYPFETYGATIQLLALKGTDPTVDVNNRQKLLINGAVVTNAAGFLVFSSSRVDADGVGTATFVIRRTLGTRGWVLAMMAIYWALALGAAAVTAIVVRRRRMWESRLLAWLGAMLFALVSFRTAAPGGPPVGTFLDFYAVFEAVGIVAVSLVVLIVYYLVQRPEVLNLTPPRDDLG